MDENHKILVLLFDSLDFAQGAARPVASRAARSNKETVIFSDVSKSANYVAVVYDPKGVYNGMAPPPPGSSLGMYSKTPGQPEPVEIRAGKTTEVEVTFDDSKKM